MTGFTPVRVSHHGNRGYAGRVISLLYYLIISIVATVFVGAAVLVAYEVLIRLVSLLIRRWGEPGDQR